VSLLPTLDAVVVDSPLEMLTEDALISFETTMQLMASSHTI
jgi:hypothetical protein